MRTPARKSAAMLVIAVLAYLCREPSLVHGVILAGLLIAAVLIVATKPPPTLDGF